MARRQRSEVASARRLDVDLQETIRTRKGIRGKVELHGKDAITYREAALYYSHRRRLRLLCTAAQRIPKRELEIIVAICRIAAVAQLALISESGSLGNEVVLAQQQQRNRQQYAYKKAESSVKS